MLRFLKPEVSTYIEPYFNVGKMKKTANKNKPIFNHLIKYFLLVKLIICENRKYVILNFSHKKRVFNYVWWN